MKQKRYEDTKTLLVVVWKFKESFRRNHPLIVISLGNLAGLLSKLGQKQDAVLMLKRSINILRSTIGPLHEFCFNAK